ncbi:MAG: amidohydrolase family protein [Alphaproteobacteria bacterium]|jgi:cytosine deaminase|nr:amidohydrolase family protein [Alphaproteobacteria bacterium]MDP6588880.1 amidohydrolase family protein [Alphaproteobacteria bacterium]MDP6816509.1 amidohydrolase family protein [Alphaproteobacteria bacterium]|tara:strand:- start:1181 stop:2404 length:1224 start_codon:yes stop_codon:yes gene_type:complete
MDLILRNALLAGGEGRPVDVGIADGRIKAIEAGLAAEGETLDLGGRLLSPGFIETHIHLDKACIMERCRSEKGDLAEAIDEVTKSKKEFSEADVAARAERVLEKCVSHGTTHMRTHLEVDPGIGMRGFDGVFPLIEEWRWAIDVEICVFPQEGLLNNPGTDELIVEALQRGARVIGAAPYTDSNPHGQIDRIFELAREFDVDIDMHLDFGEDAEQLDVDYVCDLTEVFDYGGRVTVGHVTKLSTATPAHFKATAKRMADAGVAVTVLPSTDLFLMGRVDEQNVKRGVTAAHKLLKEGVNCSLSTNNVLNPFTPFGDCSLLRMANLYANICQVGARAEVRDCFDMITGRSAGILGLEEYGIKIGAPADLVVIDTDEPETAVAELAPPLWGFKRGRMTFKRAPVELLRP